MVAMNDVKSKTGYSLSSFTLGPCVPCWQTGASDAGDARLTPWESKSQFSDARPCFPKLRLFLEIPTWLVKGIQNLVLKTKLGLGNLRV